MRPGKHGNRHEPEIRDRRLRDEPWIVGQSRLPPNVDGVPRWRTVQPGLVAIPTAKGRRSEEHTSELQSLMRISYAVFCLKKNTNNKHINLHQQQETHLHSTS